MSPCCAAKSQRDAERMLQMKRGHGETSYLTSNVIRDSTDDLTGNFDRRFLAWVVVEASELQRTVLGPRTYFTYRVVGYASPACRLLRPRSQGRGGEKVTLQPFDLTYLPTQRHLFTHTYAHKLTHSLTHI